MTRCRGSISRPTGLRVGQVEDWQRVLRGEAQGLQVLVRVLVSDAFDSPCIES